MNAINNVSPVRTSITSTYDLDHVDVMSRRLARRARKAAAGSLIGVQLDANKVSESYSSVIKVLCDIACEKAPMTIALQGVMAGAWPLMRDVMRAERTGVGTTTVLRLHPSGGNASAKAAVGGTDKPLQFQGFVELLEKLYEVGLDSGISLGDHALDGGGNFDVLSATAEWVGDSCYVYHTAQLTSEQLVLVASLNIQGYAKNMYGASPDVMKTIVVNDNRVVSGD